MITQTPEIEDSQVTKKLVAIRWRLGGHVIITPYEQVSIDTAIDLFRRDIPNTPIALITTED